LKNTGRVQFKIIVAFRRSTGLRKPNHYGINLTKKKKKEKKEGHRTITHNKSAILLVCSILLNISKAQGWTITIFATQQQIEIMIIDDD